MPGPLIYGSLLWGTGGNIVTESGIGGTASSSGRAHAQLDTLKLMLTGVPSRSDITSAIPRVAIGSDERRHTDFSERDTFGMNTFHHGRGQDKNFEDPQAFNDSDAVITWIPGQATLPLVSTKSAGETTSTTTSNISAIPDADPETTTVDGWVSNSPFTTWDDAHDASSGTSVSSTIPLIVQLNQWPSGNASFIRTFMGFDLSSIPAGATIVSATIDCFSTFGGAQETGITTSVDLVATTPTSNTDLVVGDFDQVGSVSFANLTIASIVAAGPYATNTFTLNASGLTHITTAIGNVANFGCLINEDLTDSEPSPALRNAVWNFFSADDAFPGFPAPTLSIEYTTASASTVDPMPLAGRISDQERFEGNLYSLLYGDLAAANRLVVWDNTTEQWDDVVASLDTTSGEPQDLHTFDDMMYVSQGETVNARRFTGSGWSDNGYPARRYETFDSQLWRADNINQLWYSTDPENDGAATWIGPGHVGSADYPIRNMLAGFDGALWVIKDDGLYSVRWDTFNSVYLINLVIDLSDSIDDANGSAMVEFGGNLYFTVSHRIYRYDGNTIQILGPNRGQSGLQDEFIGGLVGHVSSLTTSGSYLIAAIDNEGLSDSLVALWAGTGWHIIKRSSGRIRSVFYQSALATTNVLSHPTLWWDDSTTDAFNYQQWPRFDDDPLTDSESAFESTGSSNQIITSWFDAGLPDIDKSFIDYVVEFTTSDSDVSAGHSITVHYQLDEINTWNLLGTATASPLSVMRFPNDDEIRAVTFGKKIRYRLTFVQGTGTGTPILLSWAHRFVVRPDSRYGWTLPIKSYDNHYDFDREALPLSAEETRRRLYTMRDQRTPLFYVDGSYTFNQPDTPALTNLVKNPTLRVESSVDTGFGKYFEGVSGGETGALQTKYKMFDLLAQQISTTGTDTEEGVVWNDGQTLAGNHYLKGSCYVLWTSGNTVYVQLYNVTDSIVVQEVAVSTSLRTFSRYEVSGQGVSGKEYTLRMVRKSGESSPTATVFYLDGVQFLIDSTSNEYSMPELIHGDTPRTFWNGTVHDSTSTLNPGYYVYITGISESMRYIEDRVGDTIWNTDILVQIREIT